MRFKALVFVRLRGSVSDAAGNAVMNNVNRIAPKLQPHLLRIGKAIDFWFDAESEEIAREEMDLLCDRMLANSLSVSSSISSLASSSLSASNQKSITLPILNKCG